MPMPFMRTRCGRRDMSTTSGYITKYDSTRSITVDRPRKNAKPRTLPIASTYSTTAPMSETRSAATMVRNERWNARSAHDRTVAPARSSSFSRSKYTTYESTVTPADTMMPVTPARVSASPCDCPRYVITV